MTPRTYSNTAVTTALAAAIGAGDTSLTVNSATGYPAAPFAIAVDVGSVASEEVMLVTAKSGTTFTVTRGYDGTTAVAHAIGAPVIHAAIADDFRGMQLGTRDVSSTAPSNGNLLVWNASTATWEPTGVLPAHYAVGDGATVDPTWLQAPAQAIKTPLAVNDVTVTDLSGLGPYVGILSQQTFAPTVLPTRHPYGSITIVRLQGAQPFAFSNGIEGNLFHDGSGALGVGMGLNFQVKNRGAGTITLMEGSYASVSNESPGGTPTTVPTAIGTIADSFVTTGNTITDLRSFEARHILQSGAIVGTLRSLYVDLAFINAGALITNHYGIYVDAVTVGTNKWAIWTNGGEVRHVAGANGTVPLVLQLHSAPTANAFEVRASNGSTVLFAVTAAGNLLLPTKSANTFFAGPASGAAAAPDFRAIATADLGTGTANNTTFLRGDLTWATPSGGGGSEPSDGDKGDVTVSGSGLTWTIDNDAVSNAKLANMATSTIKGRTTAGTGDPEDLSVAQAQTLLGITSGIAKGRPKVSSTVDLTLPGVRIADGSLATFTPGANRIHYFPIFVDTTITFDLAFEVTTNGGAGETVRVAIYNADADLQPTTRVYGSSTIAVDSGAGAAPVVKSVAAAQTLTAGRYLLALRTDGASVAFRRVLGSYDGGPALLPTMGASGIVTEMRKNVSAYAAFPDPGTTWDTQNNANTGHIYALFCQVTTP